MTTEKDETFTILVKGKPLATVKADLIHAFLSVILIKKKCVELSARIKLSLKCLDSRAESFRFESDVVPRGV